ncbi:alanine racemase [Proteinivorax hydrogeniformans]|uniref:Alanine racemase n=1 Tax=Proteinivorax hydrogeniformans TaxID=1826727 RepID=A0AAU8HTZ9_9FIRM
MEMETPAVVIDYKVMKSNFMEIMNLCKKNNVKLRPHYKAHKTPYISKLQQRWGCTGMTVSKVSEGENLVEEGFQDVLIAYPLVKARQLERVMEMSLKAKVTIIVDSIEGVELAEQRCRLKKRPLKVLVKVNTGLNRCGVDTTEEAYKLAESLTQKKHLEFIGLITHAGHAYGAESNNDVREIANEEVEKLLEAKGYIENKGISVEEISVGATPTVKYNVHKNGLTEARPGNFMFYDNTQISLGVVSENSCALTVKSTVVSKVGDRVVIDAGSKTLGLDKGAHGNQFIIGYGRVLDHPSLEIVSLSEEHGVLKGKNLPQIGEEISIIPNHSCVVMNLNKNIFLKKENQLVKLDNSGKFLNY